MTPKRRIIPVFVPHLGCPNNCVFCNQRSISGQTQPATEKTVVEAIEAALQSLPAEAEAQVAFYGGSFTAIPEEHQNRLLKAAQPYLSAGRLSSLRLSTRPDAIDEQTLERLKAYGVKTIELGSQSMCDDVLQASGRGHTAADTEKSAGLIKAAGLELILQMMTGLPGDTKEKSIETAEKIIALEPDGVRIYPTVIVEDTPLCDLWRAGKYSQHSVSEAVDYCAAIVPLFDKAGIPVIRLGLNPTEDLSGGGALGGAYHPALGELVRSRIMLEKARKLLEGKALPECVTLGVNPSQVSIMVGQHRENIIALKQQFLIKNVKILAKNVQKDTILILE